MPIILVPKQWMVALWLMEPCYTFSDHDLAHLMMTPMGWLSEVMDWVFAENNGSPGYVNFLEDVGQMLLPHDLLY